MLKNKLYQSIQITKEIYRNLVRIFFHQTHIIRLNIKRKLLHFRIRIFLLSGYHLTDFQNAFSVSILMLLLIKIFNYFIFNFINPWYINIIILIFLTLFNLKIESIYYLKEYFIVPLIRIWVGEYEYKDTIDPYPELILLNYSYWHKKMKYYFLILVYYIRKILLRPLFLFLIAFRIVILNHPFLFIILNFFIVYLLIFNKLQIITFFSSLFLNISKHIFFIDEKNNNEIKNEINITFPNFFIFNNNYINYNKKNLFIFNYWVLKNIEKERRIEFFETLNLIKLNKNSNFYKIDKKISQQIFIKEKLLNKNINIKNYTIKEKYKVIQNKEKIKNKKILISPTLVFMQNYKELFKVLNPTQQEQLKLVKKGLEGHLHIITQVECDFNSCAYEIKILSSEIIGETRYHKLQEPFQSHSNDDTKCTTITKNSLIIRISKEKVPELNSILNQLEKETIKNEFYYLTKKNIEEGNLHYNTTAIRVDLINLENKYHCRFINRSLNLLFRNEIEFFDSDIEYYNQFLMFPCPQTLISFEENVVLKKDPNSHYVELMTELISGYKEYFLSYNINAFPNLKNEKQQNATENTKEKIEKKHAEQIKKTKENKEKVNEELKTKFKEKSSIDDLD